MASSKVATALKVIALGGTTNTLGEIVFNVSPSKYVGGFSTSSGINAIFRQNAGGDAIVGHFTDQGNANYVNQYVEAKFIILA